MDFIQKLFPFFNFFLCNTLGSLYHGGTRKSCLSGIAPPRIKRGEGSSAFLTNAVRWHSMQGRGNPSTSIFAHTHIRAHAVARRAAARRATAAARRPLNRQCSCWEMRETRANFYGFGWPCSDTCLLSPRSRCGNQDVEL